MLHAVRANNVFSEQVCATAASLFLPPLPAFPPPLLQLVLWLRNLSEHPVLYNADQAVIVYIGACKGARFLSGFPALRPTCWTQGSCRAQCG